jgi:hypothetical protein
MKMQVDIYITSNNQIQMLLQGPAQGAVTFPDLDTFVRFIEGCQGFIERHTRLDESSTTIPRPFLDAFGDAGSS